MTRRTRATFLLAATAALLALAPATPASAQGSAPAGDVTKDATTMLYNAGIDAAKSEQWDKAYESFQAAWKIKQHPQIAVNLGRAALKTGRPLEAAEYLTFFLRETKQQVQNQDRAAVQKLLLEAKGKIGTLLVKVNKPGAEVVVDGRVVGQAPLGREVFVDAGSHTVEARLGKERAEPLTVELKAGDSRQVGLTFGGGKSTVGEGEPTPPGESGSPAPDGGGSPSAVERVVVPVGIAAGALAVAIGGVATGLSFMKAGARDDVCTDNCVEANRNDWVNAENERVAFANVAMGTFIAGGVILAGTLAYALVRGPSQPKSTARVSFDLVPSTSEPSLVVRGRW